MRCYYPDLNSASNWLEQINVQPIRSTIPCTQIWVVAHQYGISVLVPQAGTGIVYNC